VNHGHVLVNGKPVDIASYQVKAGDTISIREMSRKIPVVTETIQAPVLPVPAFLDVDAAMMSAQCVTLPTRDNVPVAIEDHLIIEYYARMG
jgi:small subunit ribosomal protein S4